MIEVIKLEQTCRACPSQWEGESIDGDYVYIRYRWGVLLFTCNDIEYAHDIGGEWDGVMSTEEMKSILSEQVIFK